MSFQPSRIIAGRRASVLQENGFAVVNEKAQTFTRDGKRGARDIAWRTNASAATCSLPCRGHVLWFIACGVRYLSDSHRGGDNVKMARSFLSENWLPTPGRCFP